jgi:hypothetical protein
MDTTPTEPRSIPAGRLVIEVSVACLMVRGTFDLVPNLRRHLVDDWGDLTDSESRSNEYVILNGGEIFSAYRVSDSLTVWILSEWDRRTTTIVLPPCPTHHEPMPASDVQNGTAVSATDQDPLLVWTF